MDDAGKTHVGVVAQEVESFAPWMISSIGNKKVGNEQIEDVRMYDPSSLVYILMNAVKEQQSEIEQLKSQLNAFMGKGDRSHMGNRASRR